jgi:hypothetical protein
MDMKKAVSISLGSSERDKKVIVSLNGVAIEIHRRGTDGDVEKARQLFTELDGQVDCLSVGGVDLYLPLGDKEYPLYAALDLVKGVKSTPVVDGRGLKHTLERRVFELAKPLLPELPRFRQAFVPVVVDRLGLGEAASEVSDHLVVGDLMVALGIPIPIHGMETYYKVARWLLPVVSHFPMSMLFYGSNKKEEYRPKFVKYWTESDLLAGDFLFMRKYIPERLDGKWVVTNTTTEKNVALLKERGVRVLITTTPRYEGRSFGTNMMEAALTAYAGLGRVLTKAELNQLIDELKLAPCVEILN